MITGGLGFIGSTLARRLVDLGADVLLVDAILADCGGHFHNISGIENLLTLRIADVRDTNVMNDLVRTQQFIFNLAGQVSHVDSMRDPQADLSINCQSHLSLLEACRYHNPEAKIVYASTRQVYGHPDTLPVTEDHSVQPIDVNGINKAAGEQYHRAYSRAYGLKSVSLRLTNVYGPRQLIRHNRQGFIGWFIGQAVQQAALCVYGDGTQFRDFVYVDDAADAFLRLAADDSWDGDVFNVGGDEPIRHRELAALLVDVAGGGHVEFVAWPADRKAIDVGSVYVDSTKLREKTGWRPTTGLREGLTRTVAFYRDHLGVYLNAQVQDDDRR